MSRILILLAAVAALLALGNVASHAQATRTWVSGVGDDANPCSRTAPCKTFAGAISKTAAQGEISVLDPGGYGAVTITKAISIISEGSEGSVLGCGTNGIIINAGAADVVNLHGLFMEGCANGINGIRILAAGAVHIRKSLIRGFTASAIDIEPSTATRVFISDTTVSKNGRGFLIVPTGAGSADVVLSNVIIENNSSFGIRMNGASTVLLDRSVVTGNTTGLSSLGASAIVSMGNNVITGNGTDGSPSSTLPLR
jgi:Right handed beta helix region